MTYYLTLLKAALVKKPLRTPPPKLPEAALGSFGSAPERAFLENKPPVGAPPDMRHGRKQAPSKVNLDDLPF